VRSFWPLRAHPTGLRALAVLAATLLALARVHAEEQAPEPRTLSPWTAVGIWAATQLIPSPLLVIGEHHVGFGLRWQLTPLLFSFGVAEQPLRAFLVPPIARHSGSIELHASPEWACCAAGSSSDWLLRAGLRLYLPLLEHGERLSFSIGASSYLAAGGVGGSADAGIYTLNGVLGLNVAVSPWLDRREVAIALSLRYF
jgi:hypothetical protein